jgi:hypothetical protein
LKKKILSRISRSILIKIGIKHPWGKRILSFSNKGPGPLQREIIAKMGRGYFKIFFSRTTGPK